MGNSLTVSSPYVDSPDLLVSVGSGYRDENLEEPLTF